MNVTVSNATVRLAGWSLLDAEGIAGIFFLLFGILSQVFSRRSKLLLAKQVYRCAAQRTRPYRKSGMKKTSSGKLRY
jgi:hypothetical protein